MNWGGRLQQAEVVRWFEEYPNAALDRGFRQHLAALPLIAHLAKRGRVTLLSHMEVAVELMGLPGPPDSRGTFYGAPITNVEGPIRYGRVVVGPSWDHRDHQFEFLAGLAHPDFVRLQNAVGARQGSHLNRNQLIDAFHLWCAEHARADYFLTTDLRLVRSVRAQPRHAPRVQLLSPKELLPRLLKSRDLRLRDLLSFAAAQWRTGGRGPKEHPLEQLRSLSRHLNRRQGIERGR